jgi:tetratricopeptide (TPR) repeat protein
MLTEAPSDIVNPMEVGESLFNIGNLTDAVKFYRLALERMADNKDDPDRPWVLFQIANCIRREDPDNAYATYQELITEYPTSYWAPTAKTQQQVISWYRQTTPNTVLETHSSDPNNL